MSKSKSKRNIAPEKKEKQKAVVYKTSYECENCKNQCDKGKAYIQQVKISGKGNCVVCKNA